MKIKNKLNQKYKFEIKNKNPLEIFLFLRAVLEIGKF
jgi:hypothetical protein